ncbi:MAG: V-type ATP synthase subunit E [Anaerohalosphaera sp.]|nr:V-type ATP synthase subunit E [Anaerohalosphaera sp.]
MNAKEVTDKILNEAEAEAKAIRLESNAKLTDENAAFSSKLESFKKDTEDIAANAGAETLSRMLASARMDSKKKYLAAKTGLLDDVFSKAADSLRTLGDAEYRSFILSLLVRYSESGSEEVIVGRNETRIDQKLIKDANRTIAGSKGALVLSSDKADIDGGFILRKGKVRVNVSIDVFISQTREVLEIDLAQELFS